MKKTTAILFLLITCLYITGAYLAFQTRRSNLKKEVKNYLLTHTNVGGDFFSFETKNGVVTDENFKWEDDHEFSFKGEMYDVISSQRTNGMLNIRCIKDEDENALIELYALSNSKSAKNESSFHSSLKFLSQLFFSTQEFCDRFVADPRVIYSDFCCNYFCAGFAGTLKEPPRG